MKEGTGLEPVAGEKTLATLVTEWQPAREILRISALTPDASLRRYFRITLGVGAEGSASPDSLIGVVYDSVSAPEVGGVHSVNSFDAFLLLNQRLRQSGIPVPEIYHFGREPYAALLEDLGDEVLAVALERKEEVLPLYKKAIDTLLELQQVPTSPPFFAFERCFTEKTYRSEMEEFLLYFLSARSRETSESSLRAVIKEFAVRLEGYQRVPVHRDYHSWNIMRDRTGALRVIDFQDTLMGSRCYDVVGLLNDRDTDAALGRERHEELLRYFLTRASDLYGESSDSLRREFLEHSIQRDLKVVGRFSKLVRERGLMGYKQWIPGTLERLRRSVKELAGDANLFHQMHVELENALPHSDGGP